MKFLYTTIDKALAFSVFLLLISAVAPAQRNTDSPYSQFGAGLIERGGFNGNYGMGGAGIAWRPYQYRPLIYDSLSRSNAKLNDRGTNYINPSNPASFSNISLTTFEAGIHNRNTQYTSNGQEEIGSTTQLSHMALAFPIGNKWGMAIGILPFSSVGYDYSFNSSVNSVNTNSSFEGSGGVNKVFIGTGVLLSKNFSLGVTSNFLFGNIRENRRIIFDDAGGEFFNTLDNSEIFVSDLSFDFGLQYFKDLNDKRRIILGLKLSPLDGINATENRYLRNYTGAIGREDFRDTVSQAEDVKTSIPIRPTYGLGFAFEKKLNYIVFLDYTYQPMDQATRVSGILLSTNHRVNLGFEKYSKFSSFGSILNKMGYRAGLLYNSSLLSIDGKDVEEIGISFGLSVPLRKTFSTLNFGFQMGRRGMDGNGLVQEDFFNFMFGVTINDKWFIQRKYD